YSNLYYRLTQNIITASLSYYNIGATAVRINRCARQPAGIPYSHPAADKTLHLPFVHQFAVNSKATGGRAWCATGDSCRRALMRVGRQGSARGRCRRYAFLLAFAFASAVAMRGAVAADIVTVVLDQAQMMQLPDRVATIVIGNPLIADVSLQAG